MPEKLEIIRYSPEIRNICEQFLKSHNNAWIYYTPRYADFIERILGCENQTLVAVRNNEVCGLLPAMIQHGPYGSVVNSLPFFGSHGGPIANSPDVEVSLLEEFAKQNSKVASYTIISHPLAKVNYDNLGHTLQDTRISQITHLLPHKSEEALWMSFEGSVRRNVQKAKKNGVQVTVENDMFEFLKEVHDKNMSAIGGRCKPKQFFELLPQHFRQGLDYKLYVGRVHSEPVAALLLLYHGPTAEYFVPVIRAKWRSCQPLTAIIHAAMLDAREHDIALWNWGGTWTTQQGVYRFKKKWAAQEKRYHYHTTIPETAALRSSTPSELASSYPFFFVIPYTALAKESDGTA